MQAKDLELGMTTHTKKGVGVVRWIDGTDRTVYLSDPERDDQHFKVSFDELLEEPQLHQTRDLFY